MLLQWLGFGLAFAVALTGVATFFVRLVRALERRQDQVEHTLYDPHGVNGIVRKVKLLEDKVRSEEQIRAYARDEARDEVEYILSRPLHQRYIKSREQE